MRRVSGRAPAEHHEEAPTFPSTSTSVRCGMAAGGDTERGRLGRGAQRHRAASGLTQEQVAERAGLSVRTISDLERGIHPTAPPLDPRAARPRPRPQPRPTPPACCGPGTATSGDRRRRCRRRCGRGPASRRSSAASSPGPGSPRRGSAPSRASGSRSSTPARPGSGSPACSASWRPSSPTGASSCSAAAATTASTRRTDALLQALRPQLREDRIAAHLAAVGPDAGHLALVLPELAGRVTPPPPDADPGTNRARLLDALEALIASLAGEDAAGRARRRRPAGRRPVDARGAAARRASRVAPRASCSLAGYRDTDVTADHPLPELFADLQRERCCSAQRARRARRRRARPNSSPASAGSRPKPDCSRRCSARPAATRSSSRRCSATRPSRA